jgi:hypothetical protein
VLKFHESNFLTGSKFAAPKCQGMICHTVRFASMLLLVGLHSVSNRSSAMSSDQDSGTNLPGFDPSAALQAFMPFANGAATNGSSALAGWMEINKHWTTFLMDRFQQDTALVDQLSKCSDPAEISGVYTEFFQKTLTDYQGEFAEMSTLGQKVVDQTVKSGNGASQPGTTK